MLHSNASVTSSNQAHLRNVCRAFMKNAVDTMFVLEGDGQGVIKQFPGNYEEYLSFITKRKADQQAREAAAAAAARQDTAATKTAEPQAANGRGSQQVGGFMASACCGRWRQVVLLPNLEHAGAGDLCMYTCAVS